MQSEMCLIRLSQIRVYEIKSVKYILKHVYFVKL